MPSLIESHIRDDQINVTISAGQAITAEIDTGGKRLARIAIPASWTTANITFQVAPISGGTFTDLYDSGGTEYNVTVGGASRTIIIPLADMIGLRFIKIRSGTTGTPVNQAADRILAIATCS